MCSWQMIAYAIKHFGILEKDYSDPLFSPYYGNKENKLPDTTFLISEYDGIRSSSEAYCSKLKQEKRTKVDRIILPGQTHNTILFRKALFGGVDPAKVVAKIIQDKLLHTAS